MRTVMVWLLLAALPVQGWAVATMAHCGPTHQHMGATVDSRAHGHHGMHGPSHSRESHPHDHGAQHHDAVHHDAVDDGPAHPSHQAEQDQASADQPPLSMGEFKCSACASCCLGMALPSAVLSFDAGVSSDTVRLSMPEAHAVFLTAGPERPPRSFLA